MLNRQSFRTPGVAPILAGQFVALFSGLFGLSVLSRFIVQKFGAAGIAQFYAVQAAVSCLSYVLLSPIGDRYNKLKLIQSTSLLIAFRSILLAGVAAFPNVSLATINAWILPVRKNSAPYAKYAHHLIRSLIVMLLVISGFRVSAWSASHPTPEESPQIPGYVSKSGNTFVYQKVPLGDSTEPEYVIVRYLGEESSGPLIRYQDGAMTATLSCYENCRYVRWSRISEGKVISSGRIRVINDPLIHSIIRDATSGLLN